jgi:hypothetical protein
MLAEADAEEMAAERIEQGLRTMQATTSSEFAQRLQELLYTGALEEKGGEEEERRWREEEKRGGEGEGKPDGGRLAGMEDAAEVREKERGKGLCGEGLGLGRELAGLAVVMAREALRASRLQKAGDERKDKEAEAEVRVSLAMRELEGRVEALKREKQEAEREREEAVRREVEGRQGLRELGHEEEGGRREGVAVAVQTEFGSEEDWVFERRFLRQGLVATARVETGLVAPQVLGLDRGAEVACEKTGREEDAGKQESKDTQELEPRQHTQDLVQQQEARRDAGQDGHELVLEHEGERVRAVHVASVQHAGVAAQCQQLRLELSQLESEVMQRCTKPESSAREAEAGVRWPFTIPPERLLVCARER